MCLSRPDNNVKKRYGKYTKGYKVFHRDATGSIQPTDMGNGEYKPVGSWIDEVDHRALYQEDRTHIQCDDGVSAYGLGFHIFLTRKGARMWYNVENAANRYPIREVEFKEPVAYGTQNVGYVESYDAPIVVAKKMKISTNEVARR